MNGRLETTIAAIATPIGEGAISVIRVSGPSALTAVAGRFHGKQNILNAKSHTAHYGRIVDGRNETVDEVVCTVFRAPHSFTGEDIVEISCHGGIHVTRRVLESILEAGVSPAGPGDFTQRAFLNGKIDLSQAEAIADLIQSQSDKARQTSLEQLEGALSKQIHLVRDQLVQSLGLLELELDFSEEGIALIDKKKVENLFNLGILEIDQLLNTYKYGKVWREGVRVVLVGVPNAGKSSLLNSLLKEDRAIVTNIPGTTRDFIEEKMTIEGVLFRMIDTAGLRETTDLIEKEGVNRTWKIIKGADIIVLVHDSTKTLTDDENIFLETIKNWDRQDFVIVNNKIDIRNDKTPQYHFPEKTRVVETSAMNHTGIENLKEVLLDKVLDKSEEDYKEAVIITNERHYTALSKAKQSLMSALKSLKSNESEEFIAVDLRSAIDSIGEIIGLVTTEDILNNIFSKFCIGK
ncbi:MAG: tRNA uridine-5-carboxymethylaminomethyl(34) synthesis GTPase MnmE [Ignavibacteriae bacterium]|nr:MAG: tRNA uridine-5-carboxymethylaminomethyl(34) synthesis GTPase MnmE [Ignavibacteriota bacterium]